MNIQFFGHSATRGRELPKHDKTFYNIIMDRYGLPNARELNEHGQYTDCYTFYRGFIKCSEERILFFLKKMPVPDLAVIFHADPQFVFMPTLDHDFRNGKIDKWDIEYQKKIDHHYVQYPHFKERLPSSVFEGDLVHWSKVNELLRHHEENFYHRDLQLNRYHGALIQIDQYLTAKKVKTIHCIHQEYIPSWFKFNSGIVDTKLIKLQYMEQYSESYATSSNGINEKGNTIIAKTLFKYIKSLLRSTT